MAARIVAYRICETCGCFRANHRRGRECKCGACEVFKFTEPVKPKRRRREFSAEETAHALTLLESGVPYREVARELGRLRNTVEHKFPGFGGNTDMAVVRAAYWERCKAADKAGRARRAVREAERAADGRHAHPSYCAFQGCDRHSYANNLCQTHYGQWRRKGELAPIGWRAPRKARGCGFEGCDRRHYAKGWCQTHWTQWRRKGALTPIREKL